MTNDPMTNDQKEEFENLKMGKFEDGEESANDPMTNDQKRCAEEEEWYNDPMTNDPMTNDQLYPMTNDVMTNDQKAAPA